MSGIDMHISVFGDLAAAVTHYLSRADAKAEQARERYITASPGQTMTYEAKFQEAKRYPNEGPWPFLSAEAVALGMTEQQVADSVLAARTEWEQVGTWIEAERLKAKDHIRNATSADTMHTIVKDLAVELGV